MLPCFNIFVYYTAKLYVDALCYQPKSSTNTTEWATYLVNNDEEKGRAQNYRKVVLGKNRSNEL